MPNPKHKHSKTRNRKDRAVWMAGVATSTAINTCENPECRQPVRPHHVCPACGNYKHRSVVTVKAPKAEK